MRHTGARVRPRRRAGAGGAADRAVLGRLLAHPYFARPAPKSLDRLDFAAALAASGLAALSPADGAATLVAFTAAAVAATALPAPPRRWLVVRRRAAQPGDHGRAARGAAAPRSIRSRRSGWDGDALEAQCFGFLAARVAAGLPLSFPGTTGVPRAMAGGRIAR